MLYEVITHLGPALENAPDILARAPLDPPRAPEHLAGPRCHGHGHRGGQPPGLVERIDDQRSSDEPADHVGVRPGGTDDGAQRARARRHHERRVGLAPLVSYNFV